MYVLLTEKQQLSEAVSQPICSTTECTQSAFKLINALCTGCSENIATLTNLLTSFFYSGIYMYLFATYIHVCICMMCVKLGDFFCWVSPSFQAWASCVLLLVCVVHTMYMSCMGWWGGLFPVTFFPFSPLSLCQAKTPRWQSGSLFLT